LEGENNNVNKELQSVKEEYNRLQDKMKEIEEEYLKFKTENTEALQNAEKISGRIKSAVGTETKRT